MTGILQESKTFFKSY